jgi:hypothetical protein
LRALSYGPWSLLQSTARESTRDLCMRTLYPSWKLRCYIPLRYDCRIQQPHMAWNVAGVASAHPCVFSHCRGGLDYIAQTLYNRGSAEATSRGRGSLLLFDSKTNIDNCCLPVLSRISGVWPSHRSNVARISISSILDTH